MHDRDSQLQNIPHDPGIYQYFNKNWEIIYIGKAKNLKKRVWSYFKKNAALNFAKKKMLDEIVEIRYIITQNEIESLLLENNLIKKHQPKYNVLLKDDKNFLYIKITSEKFPQILKTRVPPSSQWKLWGKYFGPYLSGFQVGETFKILKKIFWYGVGNHHFFRKSTKYTLDPYIFSGMQYGDEEEIQKIYGEKINEIQKFLSGNTGQAEEQIFLEMKEHAKKLEFEEAQKKKLRYEALQMLKQSQNVQTEVRWNAIAVQVLEKYGNFYAGMIRIEDSKLTAYKNYEYSTQDTLDRESALQSIIEHLYAELYESGETKMSSYTFLLPFSPSVDISYISHEVPELGPKHEIMKLCYKNLYDFAYKKHLEQLSTKSFSKQTMKDILHILWYSEVNHDIIFECNDISHLSGTHTVASRSVIENGKKNPKRYKKFRIKSLEQGKIDDFNSMREIITRRLKELEKIWNFPDLIVIDGGKWQLWAVIEIVKNSDFLFKDKLQFVSLAKREEELFLPWATEPILLEKDSSELRLIQALRDEAHRFAISFNRDSRSKAQKKNILESLPGIWPKTRKKILLKYGNIDALRNFTHEEIEKELWKKVKEILEIHGII